jgi:hypothetical protein
MIIKIKVNLNIGFTSATRKDVIDVEIDDNATEEEIEEAKEEAAKDWAYNFIDIGWADL